MNIRVSELLAILASAQNELTEIRSKCEHPSYFVGMWSWRIGAMQPSRICNDCQNAILGITDEESKDCWNKHNLGLPQTGTSWQLTTTKA